MLVPAAVSAVSLAVYLSTLDRVVDRGGSAELPAFTISILQRNHWT